MNRLIGALCGKCERDCVRCELGKLHMDIVDIRRNKEESISICSALSECKTVLRTMDEFKSRISANLNTPSIAIQIEVLYDFNQNEDCVMGDNCSQCPFHYHNTKYGTICKVLTKCGQRIKEKKQMDKSAEMLLRGQNERKRQLEIVNSVESHDQKKLAYEISEMERMLEEKKKMYQVLNQERILYTCDVQETTFMSNRQVYIDDALLVNNPITHRYSMITTQKGNSVTVELKHPEYNLKAIGISIWNGEGEFSYQKGIEIALLRAKSRMNHKIIEHKYITK